MKVRTVCLNSASQGPVSADQWALWRPCQDSASQASPHQQQIEDRRVSAVLYAYTALVSSIMDDDLINGSGFELDMLSYTEMLKHQSSLLCAEMETTRLDLRKAHKNIARMIQ